MKMTIIDGVFTIEYNDIEYITEFEDKSISLTTLKRVLGFAEGYYFSLKKVGCSSKDYFLSKSETYSMLAFVTEIPEKIIADIFQIKVDKSDDFLEVLNIMLENRYTFKKKMVIEVRKDLTELEAANLTINFTYMLSSLANKHVEISPVNANRMLASTLDAFLTFEAHVENESSYEDILFHYNSLMNWIIDFDEDKEVLRNIIHKKYEIL